MRRTANDTCAQTQLLEALVIRYNATISACGKCGQWQRALQLFTEARSGRVLANVLTYSAAISACARGGQWRGALCLLEEIKKT